MQLEQLGNHVQRFCFPCRQSFRRYLIRVREVMQIVILTLVIVTGRVDHMAIAQVNSTDLTELSIEELMNIDVTSVSKKRQKLFKAASAIYVVTQEDIRRSGGLVQHYGEPTP